ncbi:MAG: hypothetical protein LBN28_02275, partial [Desulfovibrio sp.]|nr:hypothetical protein [Desulfovibrio sp.]
MHGLCIKKVVAGLLAISLVIGYSFLTSAIAGLYVVSGSDIRYGYIGQIFGDDNTVEFKNDNYADNTAIVGGSGRYLYSGISYNDKNLNVINSTFTNNTFEASPNGNGIVFGGVITMDTAKNAGTLNIKATSATPTVFQNNKVTDSSGERRNAFSFRPVYEEGATDAQKLSKVDATLNIDMQMISWNRFSTVALYDPFYVYQNNGKTFTMNVNGPGQFIWGGNNEIFVDSVDAKNIINLNAGTNTTLLEDFRLNAPKHTFYLYRDANLTIHKNTSIIANSIELHGFMTFDLTGVSLNNVNDPVLTLTADNISLDASKMDIILPGNIPFTKGHIFYLIKGSTELLGDVETQRIWTRQGSILTAVWLYLGKVDDNTFVVEIEKRPEYGDVSAPEVEIPELPNPGQDPADPDNPYSNWTHTINCGVLGLNICTSGDEYNHGAGIPGLAAVGNGSDLGDFSGVNFDNNKISVSGWQDNDPRYGNYRHGETKGGGLMGAYNGGVIGNLDNLTFTNNTVTSDSLDGGGLLGAYSGDIGNITNSVFTDNSVRTYSYGSGLAGGGILGITLRSHMGNVYNVEFSKNIVAPVRLYGGGILGSYGNSYIESVTHNIFADNTVSADLGIAGGGILGVTYAAVLDDSYEHTGNVSYNTFTNNKVSAGREGLTGGGILGLFSGAIGSIDHNIFDGNEIAATSDLNTGGIIGLTRDSSSGDIAENTITNNKVTAADIYGAGIIGIDPFARVGNIIDNTITGNTITSGGEIAGGGIIGSFVDAAIGSISGNTIKDNVVTADGDITAGVIFSENSLTIVNSAITDNAITSNNGTVSGGVVTMNIGRNADTLNIVATAGEKTIFQNNKIVDVNGERYNGVTFKPISGYNAIDAVLNIKADGVVSLLDPIYVEQRNGIKYTTTYAKTFTMNVEGTGQFNWGGDNEFIVGVDNLRNEDKIKNAVNLKSGSNTELLNGFTLTALNHSFNLNNGANLTVHRNTSISADTV